MPGQTSGLLPTCSSPSTITARRTRPLINRNQAVQNEVNRQVDASRILHSIRYAGKIPPLSLSFPQSRRQPSETPMTTFTPASTSTTTPSTSAYTSTKTAQAPASTPATTRDSPTGTPTTPTLSSTQEPTTSTSTPASGGRQDDADTVGIVAWQHLLGAPCFRAGSVPKPLSRFRGAPSGFFKGCSQGRPSVDSG